MTPPPNRTWLKKGIQFECQNCGNCCTGEPGIVTVLPEELEPLAKSMRVTEKEFLGLFTRRANNGEIQLREKRNYDCIFWEKRKGCLVYDARPLQCKTWPFWKRILSSKKAWKEEAKNCPGMNRGKKWTADEIQKLEMGNFNPSPDD